MGFSGSRGAQFWKSRSARLEFCTVLWVCSYPLSSPQSYTLQHAGQWLWLFQKGREVCSLKSPHHSLSCNSKMGRGEQEEDREHPKARCTSSSPSLVAGAPGEKSLRKRCPPTSTLEGTSKSGLLGRPPWAERRSKGARDQENFCLSAQPGSCLMTLQLRHQI